VLSDELAVLGLVITDAHARELVRDRRQAVADQMRITARSAQNYINADQTRALARELAFSIADEQPGVDLTTAARTVGLPLLRQGRTVAALAEAGMIWLTADNRGTVDEILTFQSMVGIMTSDALKAGPQSLMDTVIEVPPALLTRIARTLEGTALHLRSGDHPDQRLPHAKAVALADAFDDDAAALRQLAHARPPV
jgi:hypothetical protein